MQLAQFVRMSGLLLVLGLAGFPAGCGSGAQDSSSGPAPDAKGRQELQRKAQQEARKGLGAGKANTGRIPKPGGGKD
jgi:hypothetical protein